MKMCINPKTHHQLLQLSLYQPRQCTIVREIRQNYLIFALAFFKTTKPAFKVEEQLSTEDMCWMNIWETISNIGFEVLIHSNHIFQAMFCVGKWHLDITSKTEYATSQNYSSFRKCYCTFLHIRLCSHFKAHSAPDMTRWESKGVQKPQQLCQGWSLCTLKKLFMHCFMAL